MCVHGVREVYEVYTQTNGESNSASETPGNKTTRAFGAAAFQRDSMTPAAKGSMSHTFLTPPPARWNNCESAISYGAASTQPRSSWGNSLIDFRIDPRQSAASLV